MVFLHWRRNIKSFADGAISLISVHYIISSKKRPLCVISFFLGEYTTTNVTLWTRVYFPGAQPSSME